MYVVSLKTLSGKTQWDKNLIEGKKSATMNPVVRLDAASLKTLSSKTQWDKSLIEGKKSAARMMLPL